MTPHLYSGLALLFLGLGISGGLAQSSAFTYQGRLAWSGAAAEGMHDFQFSIYDVETGGSPVAGPITEGGLQLSNGIFTVVLDFGAEIFTGGRRWLEIGVRTNGAVTYTVLNPRREVTATPYALHARTVDGSGLAGTFGGAVSFVNHSNSFAGNGTGLTNVNAVSLGGLGAASFWQLGGNSGSAAGTHFLGTTDSQALELKVNGVRALRLEPAVEAGNVIGGGHSNAVTAGARGATIAGGGLPDYPNLVSRDFGSIGGGTFHVVGAPWGTIAGGRDNRVYGESAVVAGGYANLIDTNAFASAIAGGAGNRVLTNATSAFVGGGAQNEVQSGTLYGVISGGYGNVVRRNTEFGVVAGGAFNQVGTNAQYATVLGGRENTNADNTLFGTIGGGYRNLGSGRGSVVGGGENNRALANHATVGGGLHNLNLGPGATVSGGNGNSALANDVVIGGGIMNSVSTNSFSSVVGGGRWNEIGMNSYYSSLGGGVENRIGSNAPQSVIGGGYINAITDNAYNSVISGGSGNVVRGNFSAVPGGWNNFVGGNLSLAAGNNARAAHHGTFVWADATGGPFESTGHNQFIVRAAGGVGINTPNPSAKLHVGGTPGVDGIRFPDGTLQTTAAAPTPQVLFASGGGNALSITNNFLAPTVTVVVAGPAQRIHVTSHKAFGSTVGGNDLNLFIGYRAVGSTLSPTLVGGGMIGNRVAAGTRVPMGMSAVISGLAAGSYQVGLSGYSSLAANWNDNDYGYTTAIVY